MNKCLFSIIITMCLAIACSAQLKKAQVSQLSFLTGTWIQKTDWGDLEEIWGVPNGGSLLNTFRCVKDGKGVFYEFVIIEQEGDLPVMKLRHFNAGSIGWEEKDKPKTCTLIDIKPDLAAFANAEGTLKLTYAVANKNELIVTVEEKDKTGKMQLETFNFKRKE